MREPGRVHGGCEVHPNEVVVCLESQSKLGRTPRTRYCGYCAGPPGNSIGLIQGICRENGVVHCSTNTLTCGEAVIRHARNNHNGAVCEGVVNLGKGVLGREIVGYKLDGV